MRELEPKDYAKYSDQVLKNYRDDPISHFANRHPEVFKEKFIRKYFEVSKSGEEYDTKRIGLVFLFRESGCADYKEKEAFAHWFAMEVKRLTQIAPVRQIEDNKVIFVLRIHEFQKMKYDKIMSKIHKIVDTERFFTRIVYAYILTENFDGEDLYESLCGGYEFPNLCDPQFNMAERHDWGEEVCFSKIDEMQMREFWEMYPVYAGDARQYLIHLNKTKNRSCWEEWEKRIRENNRGTKKRRHNRKK